MARTERVTVNLTPEEKAALEKLAANMERTVSWTVAWAVRSMTSSRFNAGEPRTRTPGIGRNK